MRTKKKSSGKIPEKKSAEKYKSTTHLRNKPSRQIQTQTFKKNSDSQTAEIADAIQTNRGASGFATYKIS